MCELDILKG